MKKLKVIIVDDEMLIRKLIRMKMDTERLGLEIVGEFSDSESAYQAIEQLEPEIVLSDICMPGEDGISFSEKCVRKNPNIRVIIITGYNEFDYARRSLKAGVYDYLMKPVQGEELNATLEKAGAEIRKEAEKAEKQRALMEEVESNLPALKKIYLNQLMQQETVDEHIEEKLGNYGIKINRGSNQALCLCLVSIRECLVRPELATLVRQEMEGFFESEEYIQVVEDSWGRIVIVSNSSDFPMQECMNMMLPVIQKKYDCHLSFGISETFAGWSDIRKAYQSVLDIVQKQHGSRKSEAKSIIRNRTEEITAAIEEQKVETVRKIGYELIEQLGEMPSAEVVNLFVQQIYSDLKLRQEEILCTDYIKNCRNQQEIRWWMDNFMTELMVSDNGVKMSGKLVKGVFAYMSAHLENPDMNLNFLAEKFDVSSSHLSRAMKQFTGKNYGDLLSDLRIMKMLDLMKNTRLKDKEIGEKIGIEDAHYLSIWFKKITGLSVSDYRKEIAESK